MGKGNLELYVHIPFCMKKCNYCDFLSFPAEQKTQEDYIKALLREIEFYGPRMRGYEISTIYIGGGTPSWLEEELIARIMEEIRQQFEVHPDAEITIECNPGTITKSKLEMYQSVGINRLSIGLQSTYDEELELLGRIHTYDQFLRNYELARSVGYANINVDLISGLPYQTADQYLNSLKRIIRLKPEHISAYSLIIEQGTPFYETYKFDEVLQKAGKKPEMLPEEDETYRMYKMTQYYLAEAGYRQYEISNFAKKGYECAHNIGYWTRQNYLGMGLGAASLIENVRYSNTRDLYEYIDLSYAICERARRQLGIEPEDRRYGDPTEWYGSSLHASADEISRKAQMEEFMFLGLRMNEGVARADFQQAFSIPIDVKYREPIEELKQQGLLMAREGRIFLTDQGMDLANYCMAKFLLE